MAPSRKVLFILKFRDTYGGYSGHVSSGLLNSAKFVNDMLAAAGIQSKLVQVVDNNDIDREVALFRPDVVVIEALWVVPAKFELLQSLHPTVKWVVRTHSEIPFLAGEGIAMEWLLAYVGIRNVIVAPNSNELVKDLRAMVLAANPTWTLAKVAAKVIPLLNYYPADANFLAIPTDNHCLFVACFGAVRPLKNHLIQAVAAVRYAEKHGKKLIFNINADRAEQGGEANLKNIRALFAALPQHQLREHEWQPHEAFLRLLSGMDISLQVSLSETFNIVTADAVAVGLPIVVSSDIDWTSTYSQANPSSSDDIVAHMETALSWKSRSLLKKLNTRGLRTYAQRARAQWLAFLK